MSDKNFRVKNGINIGAAGSAASPVIYALADTNTGIYFPAEDQFAITIGGVLGFSFDASRNGTFAANLAVNGSSFTTTQTTFNLLNTGVTTANVLGAATSLTLGNTGSTATTVNVATGATAAATTKTLNIGTGGATSSTTNINMGSGQGGTTSIASPNVSFTATGATTINSSSALVNLITTTANVNAFSAATALTIGATTGTATIRNATTALTGNLQVNGGTVTSSSASVNLFDSGSTTVNAFGAATTLTVGNTSAATSTANISTGATGSGATKTLNIGTGGAAGSTTNLNLGSSIAGTTTVLSPSFSAKAIDASGAIAADGGFSGAASLVVAADGSIQIAGGGTGAINGTFMIRAAGSNREQYMIVNVNGQPFGGNYISVVAHHVFNNTPVMSNLRVTSNAGNSARYFLLDIGNRGGASITLSVSAIGVVNNLNLSLTPGGTTASSSITSIYTGFTGNVLIGTQTDNGTDKLQVEGILSAVGGIRVSGVSATEGGEFVAARPIGGTTDWKIDNFSDTLRVIENATVRASFAVGGNLALSSGLAVNGGDISTSATTATLLNTTATTIGAFGAATALTIGATTGTATIRNAVTAVTGDLQVNGGDISTSATTATLLNTPQNLTAFAGAGTVNLAGTTASSSLSFASGASVSGAARAVNIGTGGLAGSTTNVTIGSSNGAGSIALRQNTNVTGAITATSTITGSRLNVDSIVTSAALAVASGQSFHSGYSRLTNNLVMAWGISDSVGIDTTIAVTFPVTFSAVYSVIPSMHNTNGAQQDDTFAKVIDFSTTGATFRSERAAGSDGGVRYINYIVIGIIN